MLIPKFSVRWLLILTAVCAALSLIIAAAVKGRAWALAFSLGVGAVALTFLVYSATYSMSWLLAAPREPVATTAYEAARREPPTSAPLPPSSSDR